MQIEYAVLKQKYLGYHFWSSGSMTDEMVNAYLVHHRKPDNDGGYNFIIENLLLGRLLVTSLKLWVFQSVEVHFQKIFIQVFPDSF